MSLPEFFFDRVTADIRQQMDGVLALAEQLSRQRLAPDAQACVAGVAEAAAGVRRMLDRAIDLRLATTQQLALSPAPLRLREVMDDVEARWRARAGQAGVTLLVAYDGPPEACALADRDRLLQVFDGFLGEALAGAQRGAVEASLRAMPTTDGMLLEGRVRGAAADPTWAAQGAETRVRQVADRFGLEVAIGVMLARRIVSGLEGSVANEVHAGAAETIVFRLPLPAARETAVAKPGQPLRPAHVLVVDDNATNRMVAQALCEMYHCSSEAACDGAEAVEAARSGRFDLILMDIRMPGMDGVAATRAIRALPGRAGAAPIIALTANADRDDVDAYLAAGMNGVVEKPMKPEQLVEALRKARSEPAAA
ncbi:hybrid sensor histidine kinase/response regulator [Phenylobacterium hankyongense]|uniref:Hybrid sensor histidine kinase/response regulator n=1 Tax=Phenylobacterium hankyongense TaxID=1813876 RepID=A0A328AUX2_9CAUL|nr:response regulator [Phenylobacterium hankyongense]RAK58820.1 hybrid sensor histidine kinase/response regulator [Phenylobacterium hankyongense]